MQFTITEVKNPLRDTKIFSITEIEAAIKKLSEYNKAFAGLDYTLKDNALRLEEIEAEVSGLNASFQDWIPTDPKDWNKLIVNEHRFNIFWNRSLTVKWKYDARHTGKVEAIRLELAPRAAVRVCTNIIWSCAVATVVAQRHGKEPICFTLKGISDCIYSTLENSQTLYDCKEEVRAELFYRIANFAAYAWGNFLTKLNGKIENAAEPWLALVADRLNSIINETKYDAEETYRGSCNTEERKRLFETCKMVFIDHPDWSRLQQQEFIEDTLCDAPQFKASMLDWLINALTEEADSGLKVWTTAERAEYLKAGKAKSEKWLAYDSEKRSQAAKASNKQTEEAMAKLIERFTHTPTSEKFKFTEPERAFLRRHGLNTKKFIQLHSKVRELRFASVKVDG